MEDQSEKSLFVGSAGCGGCCSNSDTCPSCGNDQSLPETLLLLRYQDDVPLVGKEEEVVLEEEHGDGKKDEEEDVEEMGMDLRINQEAVESTDLSQLQAHLKETGWGKVLGYLLEFGSQSDNTLVSDVVVPLNLKNLHHVKGILSKKRTGKRDLRDFCWTAVHRDHIHVLHDCPYPNKSCRCAFRNNPLLLSLATFQVKLRRAKRLRSCDELFWAVHLVYYASGDRYTDLFWLNRKKLSDAATTSNAGSSSTTMMTMLVGQRTKDMTVELCQYTRAEEEVSHKLIKKYIQIYYLDCNNSAFCIFFPTVWTRATVCRL